MRMYSDEQLSLRQIAAHAGVTRKTITRLAREYGIPTRPPIYTGSYNVDRAWLYQQYVTKRRTLPDIAAECGMSTANMARWARKHGIPMRSRGGPSHRANLDAKAIAEKAPKLLRPALAGIGGWERLQRFAAATRYPTLTIAAEQLGARTLVAQKLRLEADLGVELIRRAQRGQPMQLTNAGLKVLAAIHTVQCRNRRISAFDPDLPGASPARKAPARRAGRPTSNR